MNKKEKDLFFELCKFRSPNEKKIEKLLKDGAATEQVLGWLFANRMAGVAYSVLEKTELLNNVNREFRNSLKNANLLNKKINEDYLGCIKFLSTELESCGVPYALLKGAYLCYWYSDGCRTSNDIDVLISPDDVGKISAKLKLAGFKQGHLKNDRFVPATRQEIIESKMMRGETVPFIKPINLPHMKYLEVDLNFSLDYKNSDDTILKNMLSRANVLTIKSANIRVLDRYDFILHLSSHLYKEATTVPWIRMKRDMTFYKYSDIYGLLYDFTTGDYDMLLDRAEETGMRKELMYCIHHIESFFANTEKKGAITMTEAELQAMLEVIAPSEKKIYVYKEFDPVKRFFAKNRMDLLKEKTNE